MRSSYDRRDLGGGVYLSQISDPKFKTNTVFIRFMIEYSEKDAAALALIPAVLTSCSAEYPTGTEFNKKLNALYGTTVSGAVNQMGDIYELKISADFLADRYALGGDRISDDVSKLLVGCIFNPAVENGGFAEDEFEMRRKDLLDAIDAEINDKISYAMSLSFETVYRGESRACKYYGSREAVEKVTPAEAYEVYKRVLKKAKVEISFCGHGGFDDAIKVLEEAFKTDRQSWSTPSFLSYSPIKPEPEYVTKHMSVAQANLVMAFKPEKHDLRTAQVLSCVYGGAPFSKLFANVREKMSLCYFCQSIYSETKGTMFVVSAVEFDNIEKAKNEIIRQLSLIADGEVTEDELTSAKLILANSYRSREDKISLIEDWYACGNLRGEVLTPEEYIEKLSEVTREDVIDLAKSFKLDTVYIQRD